MRQRILSTLSEIDLMAVFHFYENHSMIKMKRLDREKAAGLWNYIARIDRRESKIG